MNNELKSTAPKPFIFVLIPFNDKFSDIYKFGIKGAAEDIGAYAERVDEQIYSEGILDRIFNQINKADVIVADMTDRNPNVFYEVGYAHALGKIVLLLTQNVDDIPFDLKHKQHIIYSGNIDFLRNDLSKKINWAVEESNRNKIKIFSKQILLSTSGIEILEDNLSDGMAFFNCVFNQNIARLVLDIRNNSLETIPNISYIYLFTSPDSRILPIIPPQIENPRISDIYTATRYHDWNIKFINAIDAHPFDSQDGLSNQFRLDATLSSLPPGAVEQFNLDLKFLESQKKQKEIIELFRIRIHVLDNFHDFSFHMNAIMR